MRGNRSELAPGRKSPRCYVNTPLFGLSFDENFPSFSLAESQWQIFIKQLTRLLNDKTIIGLGYRKILQINYFDLLATDK